MLSEIHKDIGLKEADAKNALTMISRKVVDINEVLVFG